MWPNDNVAATSAPPLQPLKLKLDGYLSVKLSCDLFIQGPENLKGAQGPQGSTGPQETLGNHVVSLMLGLFSEFLI